MINFTEFILQQSFSQKVHTSVHEKTIGRDMGQNTL